MIKDFDQILEVYILFALIMFVIKIYNNKSTGEPVTVGITMYILSIPSLSETNMVTTK